MAEQEHTQAEIDQQIREMRDAGTAWKDIQEVYGLSRQAARYAYQRAKRVQRRAARRQQATTRRD